MKKKLLIAAATLLAAVLIVPVPTASYDDGGTREFKALTYKIIKWNRMYEGDLCYNLTRFYFGKNRNKSLSELWKEIDPDDTPAREADPVTDSARAGSTAVFCAEVLEIHDKSLLVAPAAGTAEHNAADKIMIPKVLSGNPDAAFPAVAVGDWLAIGYDGSIAETYPAQIDVIFFVKPADDPSAAVPTTAYSKDDSVHYIRSAKKETKTAYPYTVIIKSKAELTEYYNNNKSVWFFNSSDFGEQSICFKDAIAAYDDAYFKENALIMVVTCECSGSHTYRSAKLNGSTITVERLIPQVCTCDMAYWHIIMEMPQSSLPKKINDIRFSDINI